MSLIYADLYLELIAKLLYTIGSMGKEQRPISPDEQQRIAQLREEWEAMTGTKRRIRKQPSPRITPVEQTPILSEGGPHPVIAPEGTTPAMQEPSILSHEIQPVTPEQKLAFQSAIVQAINTIIDNPDALLADILEQVGINPGTNQMLTPVQLRTAVRETVNRIYHRTTKPLKRVPLTDTEKDIWDKLAQRSKYERNSDIWQDELSVLLNWIGSKSVPITSRTSEPEKPATTHAALTPNEVVTIHHSTPAKPKVKNEVKDEVHPQHSHRLSRIERRYPDIHTELQKIIRSVPQGEFFSQPQLPLLFHSSLTESFVNNLQDKKLLIPAPPDKNNAFPRYSSAQVVQMLWMLQHRTDSTKPQELKKLPKVIKTVLAEIQDEKEEQTRE